MNQASGSAIAPDVRRPWYTLRAGPSIVFAIVILLLLSLNLFPRTAVHLNEVYPGADIKPVVKEFGFPQTAVSTVSTAPSPTPDWAPNQPRPSGVTIEYISGGPKLKWSASTGTVTFENGSRTWISQRDLWINFSTCIVIGLTTFALCKWWSIKRGVNLPPEVLIANVLQSN